MNSLSALVRADCGSPYYPQKHIEVLYLPYVLSGDPPRIVMFDIEPCSELGFKSLGLAGMFNSK